jgi:2-iminobutanoate/2-iminopropanoate deaminase
MDERRKVTTSNAPAAIGPYSQAIVAAGLVHCSGQIALDPSTGVLLDGPVAAQAERVLENLKAVLAAAGTSLARVVKTTVYLQRIEDFAEVNAVYARFFEGDTPPARATVAVRALPKGALVEIDCIALA